MADPARWWTVPPPREVSYLTGLDPELMCLSLDPLPPDAPAVVEFHPPLSGTMDDQVAVLLEELDRAAIALFPSWLPGAERLDGAHHLGIEAVRALASRLAARSRNFGPFLADLAERSARAMAGRSPHLGAARRLPSEVRAVGLARVIASAYERELLAILVHVRDGLAPVQQRALVGAAEWLADHGQLSVWFVGGSLETADRLRCVAVTRPDVPEDLDVSEVGGGTEGDWAAEPHGLIYPPLSGRPRSDSDAELALERALRRHPWADGRHWNHTLDCDVLRKPYRLDLFWPLEGLVVEVDGSDHRGRLKYADDRRRDVRLHLLGYVVLRYTNEQVLSDVDIVVLEIKQFLDRRRTNPTNRLR